MAERTCCKTCRKKGVCPKVCIVSGVGEIVCEYCRPCPDYAEPPVFASSKPRIVAV